jgi:drug/metabolite transporter (DMT)-like permease
LIGATGLVLLFWRDLTINFDKDVIQGVGWATTGTLFFSLGNMMSRKNSIHGVNPITANSWGMCIGAIILVTIAGVTGANFAIPNSPTYIWALIYLAIIGSVVGFSTYLMMVAQIGSDRAAYTTVLFPVVALIMSTLFEGFEWHTTAFLGIALTIIGNLVMFARFPRRDKLLITSSKS